MEKHCDTTFEIGMMKRTASVDSIDGESTYNICNILLSLNKSDTKDLDASSRPENSKTVSLKKNSHHRDLNSRHHDWQSVQKNKTAEKREPPETRRGAKQLQVELLAASRDSIFAESDLKRETLSEAEDTHLVRKSIVERIDRKAFLDRQFLDRQYDAIHKKDAVNEAERKYLDRRTDVELQKKAKMKTLAEFPARKRGRFMWPESLHQAFIGAIFDIGLSHVNRDIISEQMQRKREMMNRTLLDPLAINKHMLRMHEFRLECREKKEVVPVSQSRIERVNYIKANEPKPKAQEISSQPRSERISNNLRSHSNDSSFDMNGNASRIEENRKLLFASIYRDTDDSERVFFQLNDGAC